MTVFKQFNSNEPTSRLSLKSKKQHIRLWYECFQICKSDPSLSNNLNDSSDFYEEWGDVSVKFDVWWKSHKSLFEDLEVREVKKVSKNPNVVNLSIPLNENITSILKEVKYIVNKKQTEKLKDLGIDSTDLKSKVIKQGKYSFTQKEIKSDIEKIQGYKTTNISQNIIAELPEEQLRNLLGKFDDEISRLRVEQETIELQQKGISEKNNWVDWVKMFGENMEDLRSPETTFNDKKKMLKSIINSIIVLSDDKTSHRLVINLSVNWWNDNLSWKYKTNKDGKRIKDGYILDQGEDVFITDWINTKKN